MGDGIDIGMMIEEVLSAPYRKMIAYEARMTAQLLQHVLAGDRLVLDWHLQAASEQYCRAQEIANYQLRREDISQWLDGRMKYVADNYLLTGEERKRVPDLDGLVL
ncbi:hypothetical protein KY363_02190 [Candidatus Woesearchaeota archaeon]|nr:hypothetical protein [Candidatus Woesearchaeota archaeon]